MKDSTTGLVFIFLIVSCVTLCCSFNSFMESDRERREQKCEQKSHGRSYVEEESFAMTKDNCEIKKVTKYTAKCYYEDHVFITMCPGSVTWTSKLDKSGKESSSNQTLP